MSAGWDLREGHVLDCLREMDAGSVQCCITSPPYFGLRDYGLPSSEWGDGWVGCLGLEPSVDQFVVHLVEVFSEVRRVLADDGTLWLNLGDSYAGSWGAQSRGAPDNGRSTLSGSRFLSGRQIKAHPKGSKTGSIPSGSPFKSKDLLGVPWMAAFALRADGWYLRSEIIWSKPNPMPESVRDRPTKAHEQVFLLSKSPAYHYDAEAITEDATGRDPGNITHKHADAYPTSRGSHGRTAANLKDIRARTKRNKRSVWTVAAQPFRDAHFATFPPKLIEPMVLAGCPAGGAVLDPFAGSGTTLQVAVERGRNVIGIELKPEYAELIRARLAGVTPPLFGMA